MYKPSDPYVKEFVTSAPSTGAAANADSLPVATANRNGSDDGAFALTVTNLDAGRYKVTGTVPIGYSKGDVVNVSVAATCSGVAGKAVIDTFNVDSKRVGDLNDSPYAGGDTPGTTTLATTIGNRGAGLTAIPYTGPAAPTDYQQRNVAVTLPATAPATFLDAISIADPGGIAGQTTFPKIIVALYRRFFRKAAVTTSALVTYADDGTTVNTTQALSDDGTIQTQGTAT